MLMVLLDSKRRSNVCVVNVRHEGEAGQFAEVDADASGVRAGVRRLGLVARPAGLDSGLHAHGGVPLLFVWLAAYRYEILL